MGADDGDRRPWTAGALAAAARRVVGGAPSDPFSVAVLSRAGADPHVRLSAGNDAGVRELGDADPGAAVDRLADLVRACADELGAAHPDTLVARGNLAMARLAAGQVRAAVRDSREVLADRGRVLGADHPSTLNAHLALGLTHLADGDPAAACAVLETARSVLRLRRGGPGRGGQAARRGTDACARTCAGLLDLAHAALGPGAPGPGAPGPGVPPARSTAAQPVRRAREPGADRHRRFPLLPDTSWGPA